MIDRQPPLRHDKPRTGDQRPAWIAPAIRTFRAGDAENGIVNNVADGPYSFRS